MTLRRLRRDDAGGITRIPRGLPSVMLWILVALVAVFIAVAVAAPYIADRWSVAGLAVRLVYRPICHQLPDRCLDLGAGPVAVCARCLGLYVGGLAALVAAAATRRAWRPTGLALVVVAAPSVADFALGLVGLPSLANIPRMLLALPLGAAVGSALACAAGDAFGKSPNRTPEDAVE